MAENLYIIWKAVKLTAICLFYLIMGIAGCVVVSDCESGCIKYVATMVCVAFVACALSVLALIAIVIIKTYCIEKQYNEIRYKSWKEYPWL